jgi:Uma2 family endonuclease
MPHSTLPGSDGAFRRRAPEKPTALAVGSRHFCRTHPEERYEYIQGYAYRLMARGDSNHSLIKMNVYREFGNALRGGPCRAYDSEMYVRITDDQFVLPDASVSYDERDHGIVKALTYPCLVVEVLSPG